MWKASIANNVDLKAADNEDDDWETDPDFINDVTEQEQRWGSKTIEGSGRQLGAIDMQKLREETEQAEADRKQKQLEEGPNPSFGYGGKFGVEADRMDQSAVGHDYVAKVEKHVSQKDYSAGFGGKFGVQTDRIDKSAVNWDYKEKLEKHASQKDYSAGFGGKFGVQADRQDKSAVGWDHVEKVGKHESQKDYSVGFGGRFGVQSDRQDKSAVGWDHHENLQYHESQVDHKKGFGGKFGVQTDRMDKSASAFTDESAKVGTTYTKTKPDIGGAKPSDLRAKFENLIRSDSSEPKTRSPEKVVRQLDSSKTNMFLNKTETTNVERTETIKTKTTVENTAKKVTSNIEENDEKKIEQNVINQAIDIPEELKPSLEKEDIEKEVAAGEPEAEVNPDEVAELEDTGLVAVALYDYQSAADDEISFDPEDIITHIEMIDEGWWRGLCRGRYGLFPANYVQLQQ